MNYTNEVKYIINSIKKYFEKFKNKKAILGISGGKDSTICAILLGEAIGYENIIGVMMPNGAQQDIEDSEFICDTLGINTKYVNIEKIYNTIIDEINCHNAIMDDELNISQQARYNIPPRVRMTVLRAIGQTNGAKLVCTGNSSELALGWCTLDGDMAHDKLAPLLNYTCVEAIEIGKELCSFVKKINGNSKMFDLINKVPADGLTDKTDEDNFGFTYQQLHDFQKKGTCGITLIDTIIKKQIKHNEFKTYRRTYPLSTYETYESIHKFRIF